LHEKYLDEEDLSRKGAKRYRVSKGFSLRLCAFAPLRLCAFAGDIFFSSEPQSTFRAKLL
jgi:hypothetical protein